MNARIASVPTPASERRGAYRVCYPADLCPVIRMRASDRLVLDISEWGIRFNRLPGEQAARGQRFVAAVDFGESGRQIIAGRIVRISECDVAGQLEQGFDFETISREHTVIRSRLS